MEIDAGGERRATLNIYVKSSHRAYCLDRCMRSLEANVRGHERIVVLDDGTPDKYLQKLAGDHPGVQLAISPRAMGARVPPQSLDPARFWATEIQKDAHDYTFILEEDTWVVHPILVERVIKNLRINNAVFLKLFWAGSEKISSKPEVYLRVLFDDGDVLEYYTAQLSSIWDVYKIFMVAQGVYRVDYWLNSFASVPHWGDEPYLLKRALEFVQQMQARSQTARFAKSGTEKIRHSTTSTGRDDSGGPGVKQKVNNALYNEVLNECWLRGEFDTMHDYPDDFSAEYLLGFFRRHLQESEIEAWLAWRAEYLAMYKSMGFSLS
jgi:hypothetical protein